MPDITLEEIQEKFESLPENLRMAIVVAGADKKVNSIGREHGLNVRQISELLLRTHLVMFGFIHPDKLEDVVKTITKIPPQVVKGTTRDINEQIIKDIKEELLTLSEKPKEAKEVESFIAKSTPGGTSITQEEFVDKSTNILPAVPELQAPNEAIKEESILESAGIKIPVLESEKEIDKSLIQADIEISKTENKPEQITTKEDTKNEAILKSAGIEIPSMVFGNVIQTNPEEKETPKEPEVKENTEIMKIAFSDLPKESPIIPDFSPLPQKEESIGTSKQTEEKKEIKPVTVIPPTPISTPTPVLTPTAALVKTVEKTPEVVKEEKLIIPAPEKVDVAPVPATKEETKPVEQTVEKKVPSGIYNTVTPEPIDITPKPEATTKVEIKPAEPPKVAPEIAPTTTPTPAPAITTETKGPEKAPEVEQTPEEKKKASDLKIEVKNIIQKYQEKSKTPPSFITYNNTEEEKRSIVVEIVEVQDNIKKMKERLIQLTKERTKLEKEKHSLAGKGKTKEAEDIGDTLSELSREEKMIQVLRESILPKEYLDLLVKLDKLSPHNPPSETHK